jgi:hypothetical protein
MSHDGIGPQTTELVGELEYLLNMARRSAYSPTESEYAQEIHDRLEDYIAAAPPSPYGDGLVDRAVRAFPYLATELEIAHELLEKLYRRVQEDAPSILDLELADDIDDTLVEVSATLEVARGTRKLATPPRITDTWPKDSWLTYPVRWAKRRYAEVPHG